ncbi:MAG TPA: hypothetical protein VN651_02595, partial [Gemmatimonadaceae bacterium]|nr:hypothetical protein [Gemmatimonadaceae bacterium]
AAFTASIGVAGHASIACAQVPVQADGSAVPLSRFEMQRALLEVDEQRRRLEMSLDPVDSVLRVLAADTLRIRALKRSPLVDQDVAGAVSASNQLAQLPGAPELTRRLVDAVVAASRDFSVPDNTLSGRVMLAPAAQDYLARNPNAGVVPVADELPPYDTPLWDKIRQSDYGRERMARPTTADMAGFAAAVSDSGFDAYKQTLVAAFARRIGDIRRTRDAGRADVGRLRRRAADLARAIGEQETNAQTIDARLVEIGVPVFGIVLLALLFMPRLYPSEEMQRWMFTSGLMVELATVVMITAATLLLALANRIHAEVVGTLLGGLTGYTIGRSVQRRPEIPTPAPQIQPVQHTPISSRFR